MTETICGTSHAHTGGNNGTFTVRDDSITVNYQVSPDIYEINVHYADGTSQSFGTNFGTAPAPGSTEWTIALKSPAKWVQVHSFNDHYGEPSCPVGTPVPPPSPEEEPGEIDCPEGTVPGWLDENGNPQGCVNNQPVPGKPDTPEDSKEPPSETPAVQAEVAQPVTPAPEELAVTGAGLEWSALIIGAVFVVAGLALYLKGLKR